MVLQWLLMPDKPMDASPLVSIVIPVYNGADFLGEAIDSALGQTYPNIEVIVVDDGSNDGGATRAVAERYGDRIRYVHKPNGGVSTALNLGLQIMRGEWFSWLSHDDVYVCDKIETQIAAWRRFGAPCVVMSDFRMMDRDGVLQPEAIVDHSQFNITARPLQILLESTITGCALLIPRTAFPDGGFEPGLPRVQDFHMWYRLIRDVPFVYCNRIAVHYRSHPNQGSRDGVMLDDVGQIYAYTIDALPPETMSAYAGSEIAFLHRILEHGHELPGVHPYLRRRIAAITSRVPFTFVLFATSPAAVIADHLRILASRTIHPTQILVVDLAIGPDRAMVEAALSSWPDTVVASPPDPSVAGVLKLVSAMAHTDVLVSATTIPEDEELAAALGALCDEVDVVRPYDWTEASGPYEKFVFRRSIIETLVERNGTSTTAKPIRVAGYPPAIRNRPAPDGRSNEQDAGHALPCFKGGKADMALLDRWRNALNPDVPTVLMLGWVNTPAARSYRAAAAEGLRRVSNALFLILGQGGGQHAELCPPSRFGDESPLRFTVTGDGVSTLAKVLRHLKVGRLELHDTGEIRTFGWPEVLRDRMIETLGLPFDVIVIDHGTTVPEAWLRRARRVVATSSGLAERIRENVPGLDVACERPIPHYPLEKRAVFQFAMRPEDALRVLIVGDAGASEGADVMVEVFALVRKRGLPICFHALGQVEGAPAGELLVRHASVEDADFWTVVAGITPHLVWLPFRASRHWLWELDRAMSAMLPLAVSATPTVVERCSGRPRTWLHPVESPAEAWVEVFLDHRARLSGGSADW